MLGEARREIAGLKAALVDAAKASQANSSDLPELMSRFRRDNFDLAGNAALARAFDAAGEVGRLPWLVQAGLQF